MMTACCYFYFCILFLWYTIHGIQVIDGVWYDDFAYDYHGLNGWYIYYRVGVSQNLNYTDIPFVNGSLGKYHGIYQHINVAYHYLKRTFQCKHDSSIKVGYTMAFCGNEVNDNTQVYLNDNLILNINFESNSLYPLDDALLSSTLYLCNGDPWRVYYDVANAQQMQSFISGHTSFNVTIEVTLTTEYDIAAINNITIFCDPLVITSTTTQPVLSSSTTIQPTSSPTTIVEPSTSPTLQPAISQSTRSYPTTSDPTSSEPTSSEPTSSMPTSVKPITSQQFPTTTLFPTTGSPTTASPTTANPTTSNPTTSNPTIANPTTANPTALNPATTNPTTANPTTANPASSMSPSSSTTKKETIVTNYEGKVDSATNNTLTSFLTSITLDNSSAVFDNMVILIIVSISILCIFTIISIVIFFKIYSKKTNKSFKHGECLSNIQMNKMGNNNDSTLNKLEIDDNSENSIDAMFEKPVVSISTLGEKSTEHITIGELIPIETQSNALINDDIGKNSDGCETEKLYETTANMIIKGLEDNEKMIMDNNLHLTPNRIKEGNNEIIEGNTNKKDDIDDFYNLPVWGYTTRGTDKGNHE